jgi:hypothetical protein
MILSKDNLVGLVDKFPDQIWHQLVTRHCEHSIVANEEHFILALRRQNSLSISPMYSFSGVSAASSKQTLTNLSFFIAHSLLARHPVNGTFLPAEIEAPEAVPGPQREDGGEMAGGGDNGRSRPRSDSEATVGGTKAMGSFALKAISFLMADLFGCVGGKYLL